MSNRIPPSLKWLINKRARLLGEIISAEKELNDSITLRKKKLQILKKDLDAIDSTIRLHDIPIEPSLIKPICGRAAGKIFAHGELTKSIIACISHAHPHPISTDDIAIKIAEKLCLDIQGEDFFALRNSVRYRLKIICKDGRVARLHSVKTAQTGRWQLGERSILQLKQVVK